MDSKPIITSKKRKPITCKKLKRNLPKINGAMTAEEKEKKPLEEKPMIEPELLDLSKVSNPFEGNWKERWIGITSTCHVSKYDDPEDDERFLRSFLASKFTHCCTLVKGGKICISSSEFEAFVPPTDGCCFDSSWVGVHGIHSICAVTFRKAMDLSNPSATFRLRPSETKNMESFSEAVISEVECIPYEGFGCNDEILCGKVEKPFAVVSLVLDTDKSWDEAKDPVSNFLRQRMRNSGLAFTDHETIQTAIGAFQHMCCRQELSAKDIRVASMDVSSGRFDHLDIDMITEHLNIINIGNLSLKPPERFVVPCLEPLFEMGADPRL